MARITISVVIPTSSDILHTEVSTSVSSARQKRKRNRCKNGEENNAVLRVSGGAISVDSVLKVKEADFTEERTNFNAEEKIEIAQKAIELVMPKSCIFIDGGSTTTYFARALPDDKYYVITNALNIAETVLRKNSPTVTLLGGDVKRTNFITVGKSCADFLSQINIQTAVMTATGFSAFL